MGTCEVHGTHSTDAWGGYGPGILSTEMVVGRQRGSLFSMKEVEVIYKDFEWLRAVQHRTHEKYSGAASRLVRPLCCKTIQLGASFSFQKTLREHVLQFAT